MLTIKKTILWYESLPDDERMKLHHSFDSWTGDPNIADREKKFFSWLKNNKNIKKTKVKVVEPVVDVVVETKPVIIDKQDRSKLNEGRSQQLGFAFLKKIEDNMFETVQPISPCKDYLNDVVFSEQTGKQCVAHGLSYDKKDIFSDPLAYMAMKICPSFYGNKYHNQDEDEKNINSNFKKIEEFVNFFEEKLSLPDRTTIDKVEDNMFFLKLPIYWCKYTYLISLFSLLVRCGQWYTEGDKMHYLETFSKLGDMYNAKNALLKFNKIVNGHLPEQKLSSMAGTTSVHNMGIVSFNF